MHTADGGEGATRDDDDNESVETDTGAEDEDVDVDVDGDVDEELTVTRTASTRSRGGDGIYANMPALRDDRSSSRPVASSRMCPSRSSKLGEFIMAFSNFYTHC